MVLTIRRYGDAALRRKSAPVPAVDAAMLKLASDMLDTMRAAGGVGLAAQQVGRTERLCVIDVPPDCDKGEAAAFNASVEMPLVLFNPQIISKEGESKDCEGCLSFPKIGGKVVRAAKVTCAYTDETGTPRVVTAMGTLARALQHETDHLDGVLYIDRMTAVERLAHAAGLKKLAKANGGTR